MRSLTLDGYTVLTRGRLLRRAEIFDEILVERANLPHPEIVTEALRMYHLDADVLSIAQRIPDTIPRYPYHFDSDNWAVADCTSFPRWWDALPQESRKNARQAEKRGVIVREVKLDSHLVKGIKKIYDEIPIRQGRRFWHYGKPLETVEKENSTYLERSLFVGAYVEDELVGFIKIIRVDEIAMLIQILTMNSHRDKKPMNCLLKKTMEICEVKGFRSLVYGQYNYGTNSDSPLTEFKRRNGFVEMVFPRYYIPLTIRGHLALSTRLYRGWRALVPPELSSILLRARTAVLQRSVGKS